MNRRSWRALGLMSGVVLGAATGATPLAGLAGAGCDAHSDVHDTDDVKGKPCVACHGSAYASAVNPKHVDVMPQTCESCHETKAWSPVRQLVDHPWFPLANEHVGRPCASCHTKGYRAGDTPKDCVACHQKDYDSAQHPIHTGFSTDCASCHDDHGFRPSKFVHPWPLTGQHSPLQCVNCHTGNPPKWAGQSTSCVDCHQQDYDKSPYPGHATFPKTCTDCHTSLALSWKPAIEGLHPEASFPLKAPSKHSDAKCMDCHQLSMGPSKGGQNTDCVHCHSGSHQQPAIDQVHADKKVIGYPTGPQPPSFCRSCHPLGVK